MLVIVTGVTGITFAKVITLLRVKVTIRRSRKTVKEILNRKFLNFHSSQDHNFINVVN